MLYRRQRNIFRMSRLECFRIGNILLTFGMLILADQKKLPPAFKKKLAEWEIRKAVAGKSDQNVEDLQKILPLDFNRKLQEWERIKAAAVNKPASPGTERQHNQHQNHPVIPSYFTVT